MKKTTAEARATQIGSDRQSMLAEIERRQAAHAAMFTMPWSEDQLSDSGWFSLVAVPWLLQQVEDNGKSDGKNGNANCDPGSNGDQDAPSLVDVPVPTPVFKPFQELADGWTGHMIVLYQEPKEGRDHLSRSCAMRVEGVSEMVRVLEVFFKL